MIMSGVSNTGQVYINCDFNPDYKVHSHPFYLFGFYVIYMISHL